MRCPHEMACIGNCYFLDIAYVESEAEDTDQDSECDDELDGTNIESEKETILTSVQLVILKLKIGLD